MNDLAQNVVTCAVTATVTAFLVLNSVDCQPHEPPEQYNIFGGREIRTSLPAENANQSMTWVLYDEDNNFRDFNFLWDGTVDIPGALQLDHQTHKPHGEWRWHWTSDDQGAPVLKGWPTLWPADASVEIEVAPGVVYRFTAEGLVLPSGAVLR